MRVVSKIMAVPLFHRVFAKPICETILLMCLLPLRRSPHG